MFLVAFQTGIVSLAYPDGSEERTDQTTVKGLGKKPDMGKLEPRKGTEGARGEVMTVRLVSCVVTGKRMC